jgi:hypothetical protein
MLTLFGVGDAGFLVGARSRRVGGAALIVHGCWIAIHARASIL